ncbi:MAG: thymidine kinase [Eubacterium sp.]|nr:thymidine kinase [Eubacterium sp.]
MAKLYFRYGAMGSSKSANALMVRYNYIERGQTAILIKPDGENRDGEDIIKSRIGLSEKAYTLSWLKEHISKMDKADLWDCIIVDECQFLASQDVDYLADIVDDYDCPVICYGLRTDFLGNLFDASARLMAIADVIEEVPTVCWCGKKAHFNARIKDGEIVRAGEQIELGGNESYTALCRKHFKLGIIKSPDSLE